MLQPACNSQAGHTEYVGRGGPTNGAGIRLPRALRAPLGLTVITGQLRNVLHLKSAVTMLPDGRFLLLPQLVPAARSRRSEPPRAREKVAAMSVVADISEFEKLKSCLICLSVLPPRR